jgi:hypothetical protein
MVLGDLLISLIPAFALVIALLLGRYPGERTIARLAASVVERTTRPRAPRAIASRRRPAFAALRSGELIARSLATRPPPELTVL